MCAAGDEKSSTGWWFQLLGQDGQTYIFTSEYWSPFLQSLCDQQVSLIRTGFNGIDRQPNLAVGHTFVPSRSQKLAALLNAQSHNSLRGTLQIQGTPHSRQDEWLDVKICQLILKILQNLTCVTNMQLHSFGICKRVGQDCRLRHAPKLLPAGRLEVFTAAE